MEEILREGLSDFSLPLEVTFAGENAQDYGGPRREFLGSMMREIRDRLFKEQGATGHILQETEASLEKNSYYGAGLFFGKFVSKLIRLLSTAKIGVNLRD